MNQRLGKTVLAVALGLSLISSGELMLGSPAAHAAAAVSATPLANKIISTGEHYMGVPYHFGAKTGNTSSFDCSSFTQTVYRMNGIHIPRTAGKQSRVGTYVARSNLQPGDLVFFYSPIHHVAIYIGNGKILHTYGKPGVTISNLNSGWWNNHYTTARRVLPAGQAVKAAAVPSAAKKTVKTSPSGSKAAGQKSAKTVPAKKQAASKPIPVKQTQSNSRKAAAFDKTAGRSSQPAVQPKQVQKPAVSAPKRQIRRSAFAQWLDMLTGNSRYQRYDNGALNRQHEDNHGHYGEREND